MKKKSILWRSLTIISLIALIVSVSAVPAFAANTTDRAFDLGLGEAARRTDTFEKEDDSPHYFYLQSATNKVESIHVKSWGRKTYSSEGINATFANGNLVEFVVCRVGTQYSIHNLVYESGCSWAYLTCSSPVATGAAGFWSPDSSGRYESAQ